MQWIEHEANSDAVHCLVQELGTTPFIARLLVLRGLRDPITAERFLRPKLKHLEDPFKIKNMDRAIHRILQAREKKQSVLLVGDYDVDGISSTTMTRLALESVGVMVETVIPKRLSEGYGLTQEAVDRGLGLGNFDLVIALDCGTNSVKEAKFLNDQQIDLIVVDHHQQKGNDLPRAIMVNPHLSDNKGEPWRHLCTAGLSFKLIHALFKRIREMGVEGSEKLTPRDYLPLCAIGTLADMVSLSGESRILSHFGMKRLFVDASPGLLALLNECGLDGTVEPETEDITYKLAPRINACGRLNTPDAALSLLLETNRAKCTKLAQNLTKFNEKRKGIEAQLTEDALQQAENDFKDRPAIVVTGEGKGWHPGVVGIVAGKLANSLKKPCLVLAKIDTDEYRGSGRGVPGVNLVEILSTCQDKLSHWGGHPAAVGLGLKQDQLSGFISHFLEMVERSSAVTEVESCLNLDVVIDPKELTYKLLDQINRLGPFGQENQEPVIGIRGITLDSKPRRISGGEHFQFSFHNGNNSLRGIAWRMGDRIPPNDKKIDLAFKLRRNHWNGRSFLQLMLEDWKLSDAP